MPDVTVLGAGVIGLTTAVCLAEAGVPVAVQAAEPPEHTTSAVAGALWGPHLVGADERVAGWAAVTLAVLHGLSGADSTGTPHPSVYVAAGLTASRAAAGQPEFAGGPMSVARCAPDELPPGYAHGWHLRAPLVSMPEYLQYLRERYLRAGGEPEVTARYPTLAAAARAARGTGSRVLVNCTGSGARDLVPDPELTAVRGQVVVTSNPGVTRFFVGTGSDQNDLTYLFPHRDRVVLGGTQQHDDWRLQPDPATARRILAACVAVEPALRDARVIGHLVGLRPFRPRVRLETGTASDGTAIVHNYGHGGAGVTLSWGCARDAAALALAALGG